MGASESSCFGVVLHNKVVSPNFSEIGDVANKHGTPLTTRSRISFFGINLPWKKIQPLQQICHHEQPLPPHLEEINDISIVEANVTNYIPMNKHSITRPPEKLNDIFSRRLSNVSGDVGMPLSGLSSPSPESPIKSWNRKTNGFSTMSTTGTTFGNTTPTPTRINRSSVMAHSLPASGHADLQKENVSIHRLLDFSTISTQVESSIMTNPITNGGIPVSNLLKPLTNPSAPPSSEHRDSIKSRNSITKGRKAQHQRLSILICEEVDNALVVPSNNTSSKNYHGEGQGSVSYANSMHCLTLSPTSTEVTKDE